MDHVGDYRSTFNQSRIPMQPRKKRLAKRSHKCLIPQKDAVYRHRVTREVAVNYTSVPMHSPDTRSFQGIRATPQDIQDHIDKHGITLLTTGGKIR